MDVDVPLTFARTSPVKEKKKKRRAMCLDVGIANDHFMCSPDARDLGGWGRRETAKKAKRSKEDKRGRRRRRRKKLAKAAATMVDGCEHVAILRAL